MTCENCGAPLRADWEKGVFVCDYCGSEFVPPADGDGVLVLDESSVPCPVCAGRLFNASLESQALKYCSHCHGMLVPMESFAALVDSLRARLDRFAKPILPRNPADSNRHLHCPVCHGEMDGHAYGGGGNINVDSCEHCGLLWLDGGELRRVVTAPGRQPASVACSDEDRGE